MTTYVHLETLAALWRWFIQALQDLADWYLACEQAAYLTYNTQARVVPHLNFY